MQWFLFLNIKAALSYSVVCIYQIPSWLNMTLVNYVRASSQSWCGCQHWDRRLPQAVDAPFIRLSWGNFT
jgi:hypothetical protein